MIKNLLIFAYLLWAAFSFLSNSALSLFHVFILISFVLTFNSKDFFWKSFPKSSWFLMGLVLFAFLSVIFNWQELADPHRKIIKIKYLLLGWAAAGLCFLNKEVIVKNFNKLISVFLISFLISVFYGLFRHFYAEFFLGEYYKPTGFFGMVMSYAYTAVWPSLLFSALVFNRTYKLNVPSLGFLDNFLFRCKFLIFSLVGLYLSQARGAILAFLISVPFLFYLKNKKVFFLSMFFSFSCLGLMLWKVSVSHGVTSQSKQRIFQPIDSSSNLERLSQFEVAFRAFQSKPLFGVGWRSLEERSLELKRNFNIGSKDFAGHAHNNFLEVLATTGIFGFLFFLGWLFCWLMEILKINNALVSSFYLSGVIAFVVSGLFQSTLIDSEYCFTLIAFYSMSAAFVNLPSGLKQV